jgi:type I restriction enzyme S subunit
MQFKQYPSYKNSGVEWLGDVPEHWEVKKIKRISSVKRGASPRPINDLKYFDDNGEYAWVRISDVTRSNGFLFETEQRLSSLGASFSVKLEPESLFLSIAATVGKPCITKIKTCIHDGFVYFPKLNKHRDLLFNIFESKLCFVGLGKLGTQLNLNSETVEDIYVAIPPESEEKAILGYIQTETTRIDNLIAKQEKLIELLEEQRKSIISHAVTKGLNPNAPMKDSGVEWLGDVPEHWEVFQLKSAIKGWRNGKWGNEPAAENNICCVRVADFDRTKGVINTTKLTYRNYHGENISECILDENSILIERSGGGEKQLVGATVVNTLKQTAVCSNFISLLNINPNRVNIFFLQKCFENLYTRKVNEKSIKQTSGIQNLDLKQYLQNNIAYPSLDEQKSIVSYLDAECKKIDLLVDKQYQLIRKLKNYRTSIISHAVTGKIDVREFGA